MRGILFRGKVKDTNEWAYWDEFGRVIKDINVKVLQYRGIGSQKSKDFTPLIICKNYIVDGTVEQYTGETDINNKIIFDGDIVELFASRCSIEKCPHCTGKSKYDGDHIKIRGTIKFIKCCWIIYIDNNYTNKIKECKGNEQLERWIAYEETLYNSCLNYTKNIITKIGNIHDNHELLEDVE